MATEKQNQIMRTTSPFDGSNLYKDEEGIIYTGSIRYLYFPQKGDKLHTVLPDETLQHIAYKYYGDSGYWYMIGIANHILNPFKELKEGMSIIIPYNEGGNQL